jgi:hypothetical protein
VLACRSSGDIAHGNDPFTMSADSNAHVVRAAARTLVFA